MPIFKKNHKETKEIKETKTGPSREFIFAIYYILAVLGLFTVSASLSKFSGWIVFVSILVIAPVVVYGLIRGSVFVFKWIIRGIRENINYLFYTYKKISKFKLVFYKIGNRWL